MDLVYIPEVLTYGSFRCPQYRDYEQPWNKDYFSCKKVSQTQWQRPAQQSTQLSKENCHLCRETKRRSLAAYIRSKSRTDSSQGIHEEEEEKEEQECAINDEKKITDANQNKCTKSSRGTEKQKS